MENRIKQIRPNSFKRFLAYVVDTLLLGLVGGIVSIPLHSFFLSISEVAWLVGFALSLLYFSFLETTLNKGQTYGSKLFGLRVISSDTTYLTLKKSLVRNLMLLLIIYNTGIGAFIPTTNLFLGGLFTVIVGSYAFIWLIFTLFHPQRRGLHDLASGSFVVRQKVYEALSKDEKKEYLQAKFNMKRLKISSLITSIVVVIAVVILTGLNSPFKEFYDLSSEINKLPGVKHSSIQHSTFQSWDGATATSSLIVTVRVDEETFTNPTRREELKKKIQIKALTDYPNARDFDAIQVVFNKGYSLGIWTFNANITTKPVKPQKIK